MHHIIHYYALIVTCDTHLQVQAPALAVVWGSQPGKEKVTGWQVHMCSLGRKYVNGQQLCWVVQAGRPSAGQLEPIIMLN